MFFSQLYFGDNKESKELREKVVNSQEQQESSTCYDDILKKVFFSDENINIINKKLILDVYNKTNKEFKIEYQSKVHLIILMKYIYNIHAKHLQYDISKQILQLNCKVVEEILPRIITELSQRINYLQQLNGNKKLLKLPVNTNKSRTLPSVTTIIGEKIYK